MSKEEDVLKFIGERFSYIPTEADDIVYLMTEFSSSKDARIKELEAQVCTTADADFKIIELQTQIKELEEALNYCHGKMAEQVNEIEQLGGIRKELEVRIEKAEKVIKRVKSLEPIWMPESFKEENRGEAESLNLMRNYIDSYIISKTT